MPGFPLISTIRRLVGGAPPSWRRVSTWDQGATPTDPSGFRSSGSVDATGQFVGVMNGTTQADGYQEGVLYVSRDLSSLPGLSGVDWTKNLLALRLDIGNSPASLVEPLFFAGVGDGLPAVGTTLAVATCVRGGSASATNTGMFGQTGPTFASAGEHVASLVSFLLFAYNGTSWETRATGRAQLVTGQEHPGANYGSGQAITVAPQSCKLFAGFGHGSADALNNYPAEFALDYALIPIPSGFA